MTDARKFDELVSWHAKPVAGFGMGWDPGWRADGGAFAPNISPSDPYWNTVLDKAQAAYGDPGMRFNTSDPSADRYLVFSDGTRVPTDGSLAYRDNGNTYVMNNDSSVSLLGGDGKAGQPFFPEFRRNEAGQYVPVNAQGQQVAPLAASTWTIQRQASAPTTTPTETSWDPSSGPPARLRVASPAWRPMSSSRGAPLTRYASCTTR